MSIKTARIVVAVAVMVMLISIAVVAVLATRPEQAPPPEAAPSSSPAPVGPATQEETSPSPSPEPTATTDTPTSTPTPTPQVEDSSAEEIHAALDPSRDDVEEVVTAWMTAYATRDDDQDDLWQETTAEWTADDLADELTEAGEEEITSHTPTRVEKVTVGDQIEEWGKDTPIRWSHQVRVTFRDGDGQTYDNAYRVQAYRGSEGWSVNSMSFIGITVKVEQDDAADGN